MHDSIIFYYEWIPLINSLPNEKRLEFYDSIFSENRELKSDDLHLKSVFDYVKNKIQMNDNKYNEKVMRLRDNAKKGGLAKASKSHQILPIASKSCQIEGDNVNVNVNVNDIHENIKEIDNTDVLSKEKIPPNIEDVKKYCENRNNGVDAQAFWDHYNARGWKPKGYTQKMKSWKSAIHTWEKNNNGFTQIKKEDYKPVRFKQFEL